MLTDQSTPAEIEAFKQQKWLQGKGAMAALAGVQFVATNSQFTITKSTDAFYESICIGQVPREEIFRDRKNNTTYPLPEGRKQLRNRAIDLTDEDVLAIMGRWSRDESAVDLHAVVIAWGRDGAMTKRP
jgi:hypothetical protein